MATALDIQPRDIADKAYALAEANHLDAAAHEFARAAELFDFERDLGMAREMSERSSTCRRAHRLRQRR